MKFLQALQRVSPHKYKHNKAIIKPETIISLLIKRAL
jgi:hypothetical protein